jgi:threonine dehydratase
MIDNPRTDEHGAVGDAKPAPADKTARLSSLTAAEWRQKCVTNAEVVQAPTLEAVKAVRRALGDSVLTTPVIQWRPPLSSGILDPATELWVKLELFQYTGTFKIRGALTVMRSLDAAQRERGVVAISGGNHAIAVSAAARELGITAKVVLPRSANVYRRAQCAAYGSEMIIVDDVFEGFRRVADVEREEGRYFVHPFEGPLTAMGTGTVALEFLAQVPEPLDVIVLPVGGGGLCGGMSAVIKQASPSTVVIGVEPYGADSMTRSLDAGAPAKLDKIATIADSLAPPYALPYSFGLVQSHVDEMVRIDDDAMRSGMRLIFDHFKMAVEPACAAAASAVLVCGLKERFHGKRIGILFCGSNIDLQSASDIMHGRIA